MAEDLLRPLWILPARHYRNAKAAHAIRRRLARQHGSIPGMVRRNRPKLTGTIDPMGRNEQPFFRPCDAPDVAYTNLRDLERARPYRAFVEKLWQQFSPYADPNFLSDVKSQFHPRFWEMYLTVAFLDREFRLQKHPGGGPEFGIDLAGRHYWFDAIAPTSGEGADAVPQPELGALVVSTVPQEQIILRLTSALNTKRVKWKRDLESGRVQQSDGYIVAINGRSIRHCMYGSDMPYIVKALYGFGNLAVGINPRTLEITDSQYLHRPVIPKVSGVQISSEPFAAGECKEISAVLYSNVDAANFPKALGGDFMVLHNPSAAVPLSRGALTFAREYWLDDENLNMRAYPSSEFDNTIEATSSGDIQ
jgi:type I restriction enzyme S subunit